MSYISVEVLDKIYIKEFSDGNILNKVVDNYMPTIYKKSKYGDFSILKTDERVSSERVSITEYIKRQHLELYNNIQPNYQYIRESYYKNTENLPNDMRVLYLNIGILNNTIDNIIVSEIYGDNKNMFVIGDVEYNDNKLSMHPFDNEKSLLLAFIDYINNYNPSAIFVLRNESKILDFIEFRFSEFDIDLSELSPFKLVKENNFYKKIVGLDFISYENLYNRYQKNHINLNEVILYDMNLLEYLTSTLEEVDYIKNIERELQLLKVIMKNSWDMGVNFVDMFSTIKPWTYKMYNELLDDKIVFPDNNLDKTSSYSGGHIIKPRSGRINDILALDIVSNYTNILKTNNISYETIVDLNDFKDSNKYNELIRVREDIINGGYEEFFINAPSQRLVEIKTLLEELNLIISPNGDYFRKDIVGVIPKVMDKIFKEREIIETKISENNTLIKKLKKELKELCN